MITAPGQVYNPEYYIGRFTTLPLGWSLGAPIDRSGRYEIVRLVPSTFGEATEVWVSDTFIWKMFAEAVRALLGFTLSRQQDCLQAGFVCPYVDADAQPDNGRISMIVYKRWPQANGSGIAEAPESYCQTLEAAGYRVEPTTLHIGSAWRVYPPSPRDGTESV